MVNTVTAVNFEKEVLVGRRPCIGGSLGGMVYSVQDAFANSG